MSRGNLDPELSGPLLKGRLLWKTGWIIQTIVRECIDKSLGVTITADLPIHPCRITAMYTCSPTAFLWRRARLIFGILCQPDPHPPAHLLLCPSIRPNRPILYVQLIVLARVFSHGKCFTPWLGSPRLIGAATRCRPKATRRYLQVGPNPHLAITAYCVAGTPLEAPRAAPMPWLVGRSCSEDGILEGICTSVLYELAP